MSIINIAGRGSRYYPSAGGGSGFSANSGWSVTGSFADGQIVTVTKAAGGLGLATDPRPLLWIPGETGFTRDATYSRDTVVLSAQTNASIDSSTKPANAAGSILQTFGTGGGSPANYWTNDPPFTFSTDSCLISLKRHYNFTPTSANNDKCVRFWPAAFGTPDIYHKVAAGGQASITVEGYTDANDAMDSGNHFVTMNHTENSWMVDEHKFKESSSGSFDGICRWYRNGARAHAESVGWKTRAPSGEPGSAVKEIAYLDQYSNQDTTGDMIGHGYEERICHVYVSDTLACFVLTDAASWTQTTMNGSNDPAEKREYQLPVQDSGSDTGCQLLVRKGVHASTTGLTLLFFPADGGAPEIVGVGL